MPDPKQKRSALRIEIARLKQQIGLLDDRIAVQDEIIRALREQVAADTREHQLRGAIHAADLSRLTQPRG